ncbi:Pantothenate transporter liz1 [Pyrenophora tritici-repentis]|nr:Pantothenate transporter liz1 [Pyrenophora tritici-repentis]
MANGFIAYLRGDQNAPGERKLVQKLDFFILSFCCLMYFLNYLDRTNLNNAYVSGMKEELNFKGNQLNQINTVFTVGYTIGQVPCNIALYYIKPRYFFPACMVAWAGLTMATAAAQKPQDIMAIRFFQAIFESSTFVGTHYILGSWYTEKELGKRSGIFTASGLAGTMIGGTWYWYFFVVLWILAGETESFSSNALLQLYLRSHPTKKYTVAQNNNYPTGVPAVGIASTLFWATVTDYWGGRRWMVGYWIAGTGIVTSAVMLAYPESTAVHFAMYYWAGSVYACQATFFAWANDVLRYEEDSLRAVVIASMNMGSNAVNAWWSILFYGANFAPYFTRGMWAMIADGGEEGVDGVVGETVVGKGAVEGGGGGFGQGEKA